MSQILSSSNTYRKRAFYAAQQLLIRSIEESHFPTVEGREFFRNLREAIDKNSDLPDGRIDNWANSLSEADFDQFSEETIAALVSTSCYFATEGKAVTGA